MMFVKPSPPDSISGTEEYRSEFSRTSWLKAAAMVLICCCVGTPPLPPPPPLPGIVGADPGACTP